MKVICCLGQEVALGVQRCCQGVACTCCQCGTADPDKGAHGAPKQPPACPIPSPYQPRLCCSKGSTAPGARKCCQWCCENCAAKNGTFKRAAKPKQETSGCSPKEPCSSPSSGPVEPSISEKRVWSDDESEKEKPTGNPNMIHMTATGKPHRMKAN